MSAATLKCDRCGDVVRAAGLIEMGMVHHCPIGGLGAYRLQPLASSPSAPDTRSGDAQASAVASTETARMSSPAAGGEDGDGYGDHLLDELRTENARLREAVGQLGDTWQRYAEYATMMDGHTKDCDRRTKPATFARCTCGLVEFEEAIAQVIRVAFPPTEKTEPNARPYIVASPARLDGDATGRGK